MHQKKTLTNPWQNTREVLPTTLVLFLVIFSSFTLNAQIVINEILPGGTVELKNIGTSTVDVSGFWLCDFPAYQQLSSSNVQCGDLMLAAGETVTVDDFNTIAANDGEMGLYTSSAFSSSNSIIDYVEWGSSGHQRATVAAAAGIWTSGTFVPAFSAGQSLAYSGSGDDVSSWATGTPTICPGPPVCEAIGGEITLTNGDTSTSICVDGNGDPLDVVFTTDPSGTTQGWVITDTQNNILGLPMSPPFDLDGAGIGTCLIWAISHENDFAGAAVGVNVSELVGCFNLSNSITVIREAADGGMVSLANGETTITATAGNIVINVQHTTTAPNLNYWYIITDNNDNILAFHNTADGNTLDLSGAPAGECHIWGWSFNGEGDPVAGDAISTLADGDCEAISDNWITVIREDASCEAIGGEITLTNGDTSTSICVDGNGDPLDVVFTTDPSGTTQGWVITDTQNNILGLPMSPPFDLDGAGIGTCLIWAISHENDFAGAAVGVNVSELAGCFNLSNSITVIREAADGGMVSLANGETTITATAGNIVINVQHTTTAPNLNYWYIITDNNDNILGFHNTADGNTLDLSGAPAGECHVWGWSYTALGNPIMGEHITSLDDDDCESISGNWITVIREEDNGGGDTDLSLTIGSVNTSYDQYEDVVYTLSVTNESNTAASGVVVNAALPQGMVFSSASTQTGSYSLFFERWTIGTIPAGATAVLNLDLFPLVSEQDINAYAEVIATDQSDTDSTPNNGNGTTANEDDEAALNLPFNNDDGGTGNGDGSIDLELSINSDVVNYTIYENVVYSITVTNNGQDAATDVIVSAALPQGMVHTGNTATQGQYDLYFEEWAIDNLGAGESATLDLTLFPLITNTAITNFVEVFAANQTDIDSTPGNGNGLSAEEDDEAVLTLGSSAGLHNYPGNSSLQFVVEEMTVNYLYPNPTFNELSLNITSSKDVNAIINLVNIQGKVLQSLDREIIMGLTEMNFDVSNLPAGKYFIQVLGVNGYHQAQSFVKQ